MRRSYSLLYYLLVPAVITRMLWRSRLAPQYRQRLAERLGFFDGPGLDDSEHDEPLIWVHAVSVGETLAAAPLIEAMLKRYPQARIAVTTTTPTGSERVRTLFGERVFHVYAPWDLPGAVCRFLEQLRPNLLVVMETELWPNMLHYCQASGCRVILANARLSARSARGYARLGSLTRTMMQSLDRVAAQSGDDGERFVELGLPRERLTVTGSIKFDIELSSELREQARILRTVLASDSRPVLLAASTHPGEDELVLQAFAAVRKQYPDCLLVLVPRHPERFDSVCKQCETAGWRVVRRSSKKVPGQADDILLGDTMGELLLLIGAASLVIMGGSLIEHGGHNVLEAAAWGVPVVAGPWMFNFQQISDLLLAAGAMEQLAAPADLSAVLLKLLADIDVRRRMGAAGKQVVAANRGARGHLLALIEQELAGM
ncbi:MAG: lipid IV(A) 3-deoxy-D-manno-octulosonic acid transferase [Parahaliea sp.]